MASPGLKHVTLFIVPVALVFLLAVIALHNDGVDQHCRSESALPAADSDDARTAEDFLKHGDAAFDRGNCKEAIAGYTRAIALDPNYAEAYNNRAYTYMRMQLVLSRETVCEMRET